MTINSASFTGTLTVSNGGLSVNGACGSAVVFNSSGGTLAATSNLALNNTTVYLNAGTMTFLSSSTSTSIGGLGGNSASAKVVLNNPYYYGNPDYLALAVGGNGVSTTFAGSIVDGPLPGSSLVKVGTGTLTLTGSNAYSGATTVSAGVLNIQNPNALGTMGGGTTVAAGAALQIQGGITTAAEALTLNGMGIANDGALRNVAGNNNYAGNITLASAARINSDSGTLTLSGSIAASGYNLTIGGSGNTTMSSGYTSGEWVTKDGSGTLTCNSLYIGNVTSGTFTLLTGTLNATLENVSNGFTGAVAQAEG